MSNEIINVAIYGGKNLFSNLKKDIKPYRVELLSCDYKDDCSLFKRGSCMGITSLGERCPLGKREILVGTNYRTKNFSKLYDEYKDHEKYSALKRPPKVYFFVIGDKFFLDIVFGRYTIHDDGSSDFYSPYSSLKGYGDANTTGVYDIDMLTPEFIHNLRNFQPIALFGGIISEFQNKYLEMIMYQMFLLVPEKIEEYNKAYPENQWSFNPIGKKALIKTLKDGSILTINKNKFILDGDKLVCNNYTHSFMPLELEYIKATIDITDDMVYEVDNIDMIDTNTQFEIV